MNGTTSNLQVNLLGDGIENCSDGSGACFDLDIEWGATATPDPVVSAPEGSTIDADGTIALAPVDLNALLNGGADFDLNQGEGSVTLENAIGPIGIVTPDAAGGAAGAAATIDITSFEFTLNEMGKFTGPTIPPVVSVKEGEPVSLPITFDTSMEGTFNAEYTLSFSNGDKIRGTAFGKVVPEPAAFSMFGLAGMMLVGFLRRRR